MQFVESCVYGRPPGTPAIASFANEIGSGTGVTSVTVVPTRISSNTHGFLRITTARSVDASGVPKQTLPTRQHSPPDLEQMQAGLPVLGSIATSVSSHSVRTSLPDQQTWRRSSVGPQSAGIFDGTSSLGSGTKTSTFT